MNKTSGSLAANMLLLLLLATQIVFSQSKNISFEQISIEQGLSQSTVNVIFQDSKGFLWIGTEDGLNKYDGYTFTIYKSTPNDVTTLSHNGVKALWEDKYGNIWIGTDGGGMNKFDREKEKFIRYKHETGDVSSLSDNFVQSIYQDNYGVVWIGTRIGLNKMIIPDKEELKIDKNTNVEERLKREKVEYFVTFRHDSLKPNSLIHNDVSAFCEDEEGNLWMGTDGGISILTPENRNEMKFKNYQPIPGDSTSLSNDNIWDIFQDEQGYIWIGTENGLNRYNKLTNTFTHFFHNPDDPYSINHNIVERIYQDKTGILWFGTAIGLSYLPPENRAKHKFINKQSGAKSSTLINSELRSIFEDRSGIVWFGTFGAGLFKYDRIKNKFTAYHSIPGEENSLSHPFVWAIHEDHNGILWIGTDAGLNKFNRKENLFTHYQNEPGNPKSLSGNRVWSIHESRDSILWIGTRGEGLNRFNPRTEEFKRYKYNPDDEKNSLSFNDVRSIHEDKNGYIWIATLGGGVNRLNPETGEFKHFFNDPKDQYSICSNRIWVIFEDKAGTLWFGSYDNGLCKYNRETERFKTYKKVPDNTNSLINNKVRCIVEGQEGNLWIGTSEGLNKLNPQNDKFTLYREEDGLPNNVIYGILEDEQGNLWMSTNNGLSKFNPQKETFKNFDTKDGLQNNEFNGGAYFKSESGEMFFGGINGFNAFYPKKIQTDTIVPPIVITNFQIFNQEVPILNKDNPDAILTKTISETNHVELKYKHNVFTLEFAALHFSSPDKNKYAYRMDGFDKDWNYRDATRRFATYTNLKPGDYVFHVKGTNADGRWNEEGASISITIVPPFWQTWWFYTAIVLLVAVIIFTFIKLRERSLRRDKKILQNKIKQGLNEVEQQKEEILVKNKELMKLNEQEKIRSWFNEGLAKFSNILSKNKDNIEKLSNDILSNLVNYLDANVGAISIYNDEDKNDIHLQIIATYAYGAKRNKNKKLGTDQGLAGACFKKKTTLYIEDIPEDYVKIASGMGEAKPTSILLVPLQINEMIFGVIEIASFNKMQNREIEFVEKLAESIASTLYTVKINVKTEDLLKQSRQQAQELQEKEKAMIQNMREMEENQEEHKKIETELKKRVKELNAKINELEKENHILKAKA